MSLDQQDRGGEDSAAHVLAEMTGDPVESFEYDGELPDLDDLERRPVDDE